LRPINHEGTKITKAPNRQIGFATFVIFVVPTCESINETDMDDMQNGIHSASAASGLRTLTLLSQYGGDVNRTLPLEAAPFIRASA